MPNVDLYYSSTLLGHFTLIVYDKVDLIANRIHFVDRDAEAAHGSRLYWAWHKLAQVTGRAKGKVLFDFKSSHSEFRQLVEYAKDDRPLLRSWDISVNQMDDMLNWAYKLVVAQHQGHFGSYGYVIYSNKIDNCGSFACKCLAQAGIQISLSYLKQWLPLPTLIKDDI